MFKNFEDSILFLEFETSFNKFNMSSIAKEELKNFSIEQVICFTEEEFREKIGKNISFGTIQELNKVILKYKERQEKSKQIPIFTDKKLDLVAIMLYFLSWNVFETVKEFEDELCKINIKPEHANWFTYIYFLSADKETLDIDIDSMDLSFEAIDVLWDNDVDMLSEINELGSGLMKLEGMNRKLLNEICAEKNRLNDWVAKHLCKEPTEEEKLEYFDYLVEYILNLVDGRRKQIAILKWVGFSFEEIFNIL